MITCKPDGLEPADIPVPASYHGHYPMPLGSARYVRTLPAEAASVPQARAVARQTLRDWGFGQGLSEHAALAVSELVTNAVAASPPLADVYVCLASGTRWVLLAVADASPGCPLWRDPGPDTAAGRGLRVVEAVTSRWGWHPVDWPGAVKCVWAEWTYPEPGAVRALPVGGLHAADLADTGFRTGGSQSS